MAQHSITKGAVIAIVIVSVLRHLTTWLLPGRTTPILNPELYCIRLKSKLNVIAILIDIMKNFDITPRASHNPQQPLL